MTDPKMPEREFVPFRDVFLGSDGSWSYHESSFWQFKYVPAPREQELKDELESWKARFKAIVGEDAPGSAGNRVLGLQGRLERAEKLLKETMRRCDDPYNPWSIPDSLYDKIRKFTQGE